MILKRRASNSNSEVSFRYNTETHSDVLKLKKIGQDIALRRRISVSKLNRRQMKKFSKKQHLIMGVRIFDDMERQELIGKPVIADI